MYISSNILEQQTSSQKPTQVFRRSPRAVGAGPFRGPSDPIKLWTEAEAPELSAKCQGSQGNLCIFVWPSWCAQTNRILYTNTKGTVQYVSIGLLMIGLHHRSFFFAKERRHWLSCGIHVLLTCLPFCILNPLKNIGLSQIG